MARDLPWHRWTLEQWQQYRTIAVEYLASDPGWKVGPEVVRMCDAFIARRRE